jgi:hypothetical protein
MSAEARISGQLPQFERIAVTVPEIQARLYSAASRRRKMSGNKTDAPRLDRRSLLSAATGLAATSVAAPALGAETERALRLAAAGKGATRSATGCGCSTTMGC